LENVAVDGNLAVHLSLAMGFPEDVPDKVDEWDR
jgi:hypothetical protein